MLQQPHRRLHGQCVHRPRTLAGAQLPDKHRCPHDKPYAQARNTIGLRQRVQLQDIPGLHSFLGRKQWLQRVVLIGLIQHQQPHLSRQPQHLLPRKHRARGVVRVAQPQRGIGPARPHEGVDGIGLERDELHQMTRHPAGILILAEGRFSDDCFLRVIIPLPIKEGLGGKSDLIDCLRGSTGDHHALLTYPMALGDECLQRPGFRFRIRAYGVQACGQIGLQGAQVGVSVDIAAEVMAYGAVAEGIVAVAVEHNCCVFLVYGRKVT